MEEEKEIQELKSEFIRTKRQGLKTRKLWDLNYGQHSLIVGGTGSGKSVFMCGNEDQSIQGLLTNPEYLRYKYHNIFLIHEDYDGDAYEMLRLPPNHILKTYDNKQIAEAYEWAKMRRATKGEKTLFILEDCLVKLVENKDKRNAEANILEQMLCNGRKNHISVMLITQRYKSVSPTIRANLSFLVCFDTVINAEYLAIRDDFKPRGMPTKLFESIWDDIFSKKYGTLTVDLRAGQKGQIYKNLEYYI